MSGEAPDLRLLFGLELHIETLEILYKQLSDVFSNLICASLLKFSLYFYRKITYKLMVIKEG
ncbi:hypothetical protein Lqua_1849 [Legionella quateirensis]|uniref:Uncharacterized protein n=1 Tax=Legionella quateirensis TaxID=45072 RepID=A0ABR5RP71_9GAMM|nr:hypothetical protein Lqua_1849 [Legionella quateirensis]